MLCHYSHFYSRTFSLFACSAILSTENIIYHLPLKRRTVCSAVRYVFVSGWLQRVWYAIQLVPHPDASEIEAVTKRHIKCTWSLPQHLFNFSPTRVLQEERNRTTCNRIAMGVSSKCSWQISWKGGSNPPGQNHPRSETPLFVSGGTKPLGQNPPQVTNEGALFMYLCV